MKKPINTLDLSTARLWQRYHAAPVTPAPPDGVPVGWIVAGIVWTFVAVVAVKGCQ